MTSNNHTPPTLFAPQTVSSLRDRVYDLLRDAIFSGTLAPGQRIIERELAMQMHISTTPVKEALRRLEQDGLIVTQPRRGAVVSDLALISVEEIIGIRAILEGMAARLAATKMTDAELAALAEQVERMGVLTQTMDHDALYAANLEFHDMILHASHNRLIMQFVLTLRPFAYNIGRKALTYSEEVQRAFNEHQGIYVALTRRDAENAECLMQEHILRTVKFVIDQTKDEQKRHELSIH